MILVLGGTHEGLEISKMLARNDLKHMLSVTTSLGQKKYSGPDTNCVIKCFTEMTLCAWILEQSIKLIIDATHPHALEIKKTAKKAADKMQIPYIRYERHHLEVEAFQSENITTYKGMDEVIQALKRTEISSHRYLITGTKHIETFYQCFDKSKCFFRVMPSTYSLSACEAQGVPLENIIGIKAPCPIELNQALFKAYGITHFIFKNSGEGSAFKSNLTSIRKTQIKGLILNIEPEDQVFAAENLDALRILIHKMYLTGGYDV